MNRQRTSYQDTSKRRKMDFLLLLVSWWLVRMIEHWHVGWVQDGWVWETWVRKTWVQECWVWELLTHVGACMRHTHSGLVRPAHARVFVLAMVVQCFFILLGLYVR